MPVGFAAPSCSQVLDHLAAVSIANLDDTVFVEMMIGGGMLTSAEVKGLCLGFKVIMAPRKEREALGEFCVHSHVLNIAHRRQFIEEPDFFFPCIHDMSHNLASLNEVI